VFIETRTDALTFAGAVVAGEEPVIRVRKRGELSLVGGTLTDVAGRVVSFGRSAQ
jgi:hypothetical protein